MRKLFSFILAALVFYAAAPLGAEDVRTSPATFYETIDTLTGANGSFNETEGVYKVTLPRTDLAVTIAGVKMVPAMGLTAWAAFKQTGDHVMVMGDMVLIEDQVNPVMSVALENGLEVTALHNHFFWDNPKVMFMHVGGMGDVESLASAVGHVFKKIEETSKEKAAIPYAEIDPAQTSLDTEKIKNILGIEGEFKNGVYKISIGRITKMQGHETGNAMGVNTWAAFAGSNEFAVVDGDFAMVESELQEVLKALRRNGIYIVAIHNHMTLENPRMIFLHYWGVGPVETLAKALKDALDTQNFG